jgi:hypothetical protein
MEDTGTCNAHTDDPSEPAMAVFGRVLRSVALEAIDSCGAIGPALIQTAFGLQSVCHGMGR